MICAGADCGRGLRSDNTTGLCQACYRKAYVRANRLHLAEKQRLYREDIPRTLWQTARKRAAPRGIEFNLAVEDIHVPTHCPLLGIELHVGTREDHDHSPSIDRIDSSRGYTADNVQVVSHLANRAKSNLTPEQLHAFCTAWLETEGWDLCERPRLASNFIVLKEEAS